MNTFLHKLFTNKTGVFFTALICTAAWGMCYPLIKLNQLYFSVNSTDAFSQFLLAGVRMTLSGIMILLFSLSVKSFSMPKKKEAAGIAAVMLFQTVIHYALTYIGQGMTDGSKTPVLKETSSFFIIIIMHFVSHDDKLNFKKAAGCIIGFAGIIVMNINSSFTPSFSAGDLIILGAALSNAIGYVFLKFSVSSSSPSAVMGFSHLGGGLLMSVIGLIGGGKLVAVSQPAFLYLILIVIFTAVPYLLWSELYKYNKASLMSVYSLSTPLFGMIFTAAFFPGTNIFTINNLIAVLLIITGILLVNVNFSRKSKTCEQTIDSDETIS